MTYDMLIKTGFDNYEVTTTPVPDSFRWVVACYVGLLMIFLLYFVIKTPNSDISTSDNNDRVQDGADAALPPLAGSLELPSVAHLHHPTEESPTNTSLPFQATEHATSYSEKGISYRHQQPQDPPHRSLRRRGSAASSHQGSHLSTPSQLSWNSLRLKHTRPLGRSMHTERVVQWERRSQFGGDDGEEESNAASQKSPASFHRLDPSSSTQQHTQQESTSYQSLLLMNQESRLGSTVRSSYAASETSLLPPLSPDVLAPEDAADAHDVGVSLVHESVLQRQSLDPQGPKWWMQCLAVAEMDSDVRNIARLAVYPTIDAVINPLYRIIVSGIISHTIGTEAMIAYVFVNFLLKISVHDILLGALLDAESTLLQYCHDGTKAGKYQQAAVWAVVFIIVPVLLIWVYMVDDLARWFQLPGATPALAANYTSVIVVDVAIQAITRVLTIFYHIHDMARFDFHFVIIVTLSKLLLLASILFTVNSPSLSTISWMEVISSATFLSLKATFVVYKDTWRSYKSGLISTLVFYDKALTHEFMMVMLPLLAGSFAELREWGILAFFVQSLGGAEASVWITSEMIWEIFEASMEGLADAASVVVAMYISEEAYEHAHFLSRKIILIACIGSALIVSVFVLMAPRISVEVTSDSVMQQLFLELSGSTAIAACVAMITQVLWGIKSVIGGESWSTLVILASRWLLSVPLAVSLIFAAAFDLRSVALAFTLGYGASSFVLLFSLMRRDWRDLNVNAMDNDDDDDDDDDDEHIESELSFEHETVM